MTMLTDQQLWQISVGAILGDANDHTYESLQVFSVDNSYWVGDVTLMLSRDWGIKDKHTMLETVQNLVGDGGHKASYQSIVDYWGRFNRDRSQVELQQYDVDEYAKISIALTHQFAFGEHGILAWDLGRCVPMLRDGYSLGWLSEEETWSQLLKIAKHAQESYESWSSFGTAYIVGRLYWSSGGLSESTCSRYFDKLGQILANDQHPWCTLPWDLDLD